MRPIAVVTGTTIEIGGHSTRFPKDGLRVADPVRARYGGTQDPHLPAPRMVLWWTERIDRVTAQAEPLT